jgi:hypothetical protein
MLEECQVILSLQETDLEVWEAKLTEEQAHSLPSFDGCDLSAELEKLRTLMDGVEDECVTKVGKLSTLVVSISNALVNLEMLPIRDIPQLPKSVQEVLAIVSLILEHLQEEHVSSASPWD